MSGSPGTPDGKDTIRDYEFTPIGYVKERETSVPTIANNGTRKRSSPYRSPVADNDGPPQKAFRADDTLNSTRIFNDSSFDDTLPSQSVLNSVRKNRISELQENGIEEDNGGTSNPLKEQQETLYKLNVENYNLRVKCNSLLKFLNNVTDEGELRKNLALIDELQEWKGKYQELKKAYRSLQLKFDQTEHREQGKLEKDTHSNEKEMKSLQSKLQEYQKQVTQSKKLVESLEKKLEESASGSKEIEEKFEHKSRLLQERIDKFESAVNSKDKELENNRKEIKDLRSDLQKASLGSSSLANEKLESKSKEIESLQNKLKSAIGERAAAEDLLKESQDALDSLRAEFSAFRQESGQKLDDLSEAKLKSEQALKQMLEERASQNERLHQSASSLEQHAAELSSKLQLRDQRIKELEEETQELQRINQRTRDLHDGKASEKLQAQNQKLGDLRSEIKRIKSEKEELEKDNDKLRKRIVAQATKSPALKANARKNLEKDAETEKLKSRVRDLEQELAVSRDALNKLRHTYRHDTNELKLQLEGAETDQASARRSLEKEVDRLKFEIDSLRESRKDEIAIMENRFNLLRRENEQLSGQGGSQLASLQKTVSEKQKEIDELVQRCSDNTMERLRLNRELAKAQEAEAEGKREASKLSARLEYITKEFVKYKETKLQSGEAGADRLNEKWSEKYRHMKQRLLNELKVLQEENLELERATLERKGSAGTGTYSIGTSSLQDQLDYYRLRYHREVAHTNDLNVMNDYLNRVLRASAQHVRLDILKLENEAPPDAFPEYTYRGRLRFKTVALLVLAAVRVQRASLKLRWDSQRLNYLRKKIALEQDKVTW
ncbi:LAQU0S04e00980g1_1 [Lachancea quebecensis]|uniref:Spindle pole body component 110 n=1 Tax=Lachancea quebecensis TaxID=1654605 RepID=A0A0N7MLB2_9SACH|nr:LAQU0S04e00980g1_1 [Lachancea quebecensis]